MREDVVLCLAGNGELIEQWKTWWRASTLVKNYPPFTSNNGDSVALYAVDLLTNKLWLLSNQIDATYVDSNSKEVRALFSGSGGALAFTAWRRTLDVKQSIIEAISNDFCSGGSVRFIDYHSQLQDLEDSFHTIKDVQNELVNRGYVMDIKSLKNPIPITDQAFGKMRDSLAANVAAIGAPLGHQSVTLWDEPALARLDALVDMMAERESHKPF
ncbi:MULTISPECIES: hypothetical protein [unclassified Tatumella]|uniref:hypothetical protein n=1 Tax=unclassified Tatumella TaxID=2649542 RepID=UPI001BAF52A6|nr:MULTISPECIES: hypothetical protein [unclassified Tatumella]MBS0854550.1 hypothetical protein [Tatumella sp. JGM16]MBS0911254.1 hypothetical protein [Tatumella sp. JGM91]